MNIASIITEISGIEEIAAIDEEKLAEALEEFSKAKLEKLWSSIEREATQLKSCTNEQECIEKATAISIIATWYFKSKGQSFRTQLSQAVLSSIFHIHKLLGKLTFNSSECSSFKTSVSLLCETLVLANAPGSDQFLPELLPYLLVECSKPDCKEAIFKRLNALRHGFLKIEIDDGHELGIQRLILRAFANPLILKSNDGLQFLAYLLAKLGGSLCESVATIIRNQIIAPGQGSRNVAALYGSMFLKATVLLFPATNSTNGQQQLPVEAVVDPAQYQSRRLLEETIQAYLHDAVHAQDPKYFQALRRLIKSFHDAQRFPWQEDMLTRIFDPIIWRSLRCANAMVRVQATALFLDVFPLQKSTSNPEEADAIIQKQFDQLSNLLKDADQRVRGVATQGICHILKEYWEVLPIATIHNLLKYVVETLAVDSTCADVRVAAIRGIKDILMQTLSHPTVRVLLPFLQKTIFDKSDKVRLAFYELLHEVKTMRDIHYYDIVKPDQLFSRLVAERDEPEVLFAVSSLLLNSFFPQPEEEGGSSVGKEQIERCLQMIDENAAASEAFYSCLYRHLPIGSVAKFIGCLWGSLISLTKQKIKHVTNANSAAVVGDKKKRGRNDPDRQMSAEAFEKLNGRIFGLIRVIYGTLQGAEKSLQNQKPSIDFFAKFFTNEAFVMATEAMLVEGSTDVIAAGTLFEMMSTFLRLQSRFYEQSEEQSYKVDLKGLVSAIQASGAESTHVSWCLSAVFDLMFELNRPEEFLQLVSIAVKGMVNAFGASNKNKKSRTEEAQEAAIIELHGAVLVFTTITNEFAEKMISQPEQMKQVQEATQVTVNQTIEALVTLHNSMIAFQGWSQMALSLWRSCAALKMMTWTHMLQMNNNAETATAAEGIDQLLGALEQIANKSSTWPVYAAVLAIIIGDAFHAVPPQKFDLIVAKLRDLISLNQELKEQSAAIDDGTVEIFTASMTRVTAIVSTAVDKTTATILFSAYCQ